MISLGEPTSIGASTVGEPGGSGVLDVVWVSSDRGRMLDKGVRGDRGSTRVASRLKAGHASASRGTGVNEL